MPSVDSLTIALRGALLEARRDRDRPIAGVMGTALSALEHAAAVPAEDRGMAIEEAPTGVGTTDVPRRQVGDIEAEAIVVAEIIELDNAAATLDDAGRPRDAANLRRAAARLRQVVAAAENG